MSALAAVPSSVVQRHRSDPRDRCRRKFFRLFPHGFRDETYQAWERDYKVDAHESWERVLDHRHYRALLRAFVWLHEQADYPPEGDDVWLAPLVDFHYGSHFWDGSLSKPGKNMAWTEWTHGTRIPATVSE